MKKYFKCFLLLIIILNLSFMSFSGCESFKKPISKNVVNSVDLFNAFNGSGFKPANLVLNMDYSGYMEYYITSTTIAEQTNVINTAVENINKLRNTYSEGDYQAGYKAIYVQGKNIIQADKTTVSVKIEFININYLNKIKVQTLEKYLSENNDSQVNNNFTDVNTGGITSIVTNVDKQNTYVVTYNGVVNHVPVTVKGTSIICYKSSGFLEANNDTISFSTADSLFVYVESKMPEWLIILTSVLGAAFIITIIIKLVKNNKKNRQN